MAEPVCCIDLDGTLVSTDTLWELVLKLVRQSPWTLLLLPLWLMRGRAVLKEQVSARVQLRADLLPYRQELLEEIARRRERGQRIYLTTAADRRTAESVARHLGLFDGVLATQGGRNLKGDQKRNAIQSLMNGTPFEYWGDSRSDIPVWRHAAVVHAVAPSFSLRRQLSRLFPTADCLPGSDLRLRSCLRLARPHQWAKNLLLFLPIFASHQLGNSDGWLSLALAFVAFSGFAAAGHIINDLFDLEADRSHPEKRQRPMAAGKVTPAEGLLLAGGLLLASLVLSWTFLPHPFWLVGLGYLALSLWYSLSLKQLVMVDVILLAGLYSYRIWAGGMVIGVEISPWLFGFSTFFFLNLAFLKRYIDLRALPGDGVGRLNGRDYQAEDAEVLRGLGPAAGYMSLVVLAMYVNSDAVRLEYDSPRLLWLVCPALAYWIGRSWLLANRGVVHFDPVAFALRDRASYVVLAAVALVYAAAS